MPFAFWDTCTSHTNVIVYIFVISYLPGILAGALGKKHGRLGVLFLQCGRALRFCLILQIMFLFDAYDIHT